VPSHPWLYLVSAARGKAQTRLKVVWPARQFFRAARIGEQPPSGSCVEAGRCGHSERLPGTARGPWFDVRWWGGGWRRGPGIPTRPVAQRLRTLPEHVFENVPCPLRQPLTEVTFPVPWGSRSEFRRRAQVRDRDAPLLLPGFENARRGALLALFASRLVPAPHHRAGDHGKFADQDPATAGETERGGSVVASRNTRAGVCLTRPRAIEEVAG